MPKSPNLNYDSNLAVYVSGVSKTYHQGGTDIHALKQIHFEAKVGELQMIVGPSGCGKTTLLSVIAGTMQFDEGEIVVFDTPLKNMSRQEMTDFRKKNIGFIFQQFNLIATLSILENVSIPLLLNGWTKKDAEDQALKQLEIVGLKGREHGSPSKLSGGQQQRIAIARALVHEPRLIICDEPTASLDADTGAKVLELMCDIARTPGRSVIVVTHDNRIFKYADRMARMDDGRITEVNEADAFGTSKKIGN